MHVFCRTLALLLLTTTAAAQTQELTFERVPIEGRPTAVVAIAQDHVGFMWFGTDGGLVRYDGYRQTVFTNDPADSTSLSSNRVECLYVDRRGVLWVGTHGEGLNRFDPVTETFTRFLPDPGSPASLSDGLVADILEDRNGDFWIATYAGLDRMYRDTGTFTHFRHDPEDPASLSHVRARVLYEDRQGTLWIGTSDTPESRCCGLNRFDRETETFTRFLPDPDDPRRLAGGPILALYEDSRGTFWVGTTGTDGLYTLDRATGVFTRRRYDPSAGSGGSPDDPDKPSQPRRTKGTPGYVPWTSFIYEDGEGALWIGAIGGGINRYDPATGTQTHYEVNLDAPEDPRSLPDNNVWRLHEGRDGTLWIGSWNGGLVKVSERTALPQYLIDPKVAKRTVLPQYLFDRAGPEAVNQVLSFHEDRAGALWVGTGGGLFQYDRATRTVLAHYLNDSPVPAIHEDARGTFWIGTAGDGLVRFDPRKEMFRSYTPRPGDETSLSGAGVPTILEDRAGDLWIGGGRFQRMDRQRGTFERFSPDVTTLYEDRHGVLWGGTWNSGMWRFDPSARAGGSREMDTFERFLPGRSIPALYEDRNGVFWVGTVGQGLLRFDRETGAYEAFTSQNSDLPHNDVTGIVDDEAGRLWLITGGALARFDPETESFRSYPGQRAEPFYPRFYRSARGELFVGGEHGFHAFFPEVLVSKEVGPNMHAPDIALTGFRLSGEPVLPGAEAPLRAPIWEAEEVRLSHDQNVFSFDFAGFHYRDPSKNRHRYMLENFDEAWREAGSDLTETYVKVPPGEYVFRVQAANSDGVWNEEGASIRVVLLPPWWRTWWAYAFYVLAVLGVVVGGYRWRVRQLRQQAVDLHRMVRERTRELVAEKKKTEEQAQQLLELGRAKDRFFANVSHEFRTPLTLILGPLEDVLDGVHGSADPQVHRQLRSILRNGRHLHRLISELLDLTRLDVGRLPLDRRRGNLVALLRGVVRSFAPLAERRQVTLQLYAESNELWFEFDGGKLEKVVDNLLSNALKFTSEGGKVRVELRRVADGADAFAEVSVRDTGCGISEEALPRVFDRFYRVDEPPTRVHEGTGIGLALAQSLVVLHGGVIDVESREGFGSTFTVRLPLVGEHPQPGDAVEGGEAIDEEPGSPPAVWEAADGGGASSEASGPAHPPDSSDGPRRPTILVVEDNAGVRDYLKGHLSEAYHVVEAGDGAEGWEKARAVVPDLVIADVMMPEMDGVALCRVIKADERLNHVPVVLLTAKASDEAQIEGLESGADDYVTKPFNAEALLARVENLIEIRRVLRRRFSGEVVVQPGEVAVPSEEAAFLGRVREVVESRLGDGNFTVEWLADEVGLSPRQLRRRLQAIVRLSPAGFIRMMRLERAAQLLERHAGNVSEVAHAVGFSDVNYFSHLFRQTFGVPPSQYGVNRT